MPFIVHFKHIQLLLKVQNEGTLSVVDIVGYKKKKRDKEKTESVSVIEKTYFPILRLQDIVHLEYML